MNTMDPMNTMGSMKSRGPMNIRGPMNTMGPMNTTGPTQVTIPPKTEAPQKLIASPEVLQVFHCNVCNCLLSVPPIRLVENVYVCGRCPGDGFRQVPLEKFASLFKFPCRYVQEGCKLDLIWSEIEQHEQACCHQPANCFLASCGWKGTRTGLVQHFGTAHESQVLSEKDSIKLSNVKPAAKYFYFIGDDTGFEIEIENSDELEFITYKVAVLWSKLDSSSFAYKVTFLDEEVHLSFFYQAKALGVPQDVEMKTLKSIIENIGEAQMNIKIAQSKHIKYSYDVCAVCSSPLIKSTYVTKSGHGICKTCSKSDQFFTCTKHRKCDVYQSCGSTTKNYSLNKVMDSFCYNLK